MLRCESVTVWPIKSCAKLWCLLFRTKALFSHTNLTSISSNFESIWYKVSLQIVVIPIGCVQNIQNSRSNIFWMPVDPLSFWQFRCNTYMYHYTKVNHTTYMYERWTLAGIWIGLTFLLKLSVKCFIAVCTVLVFYTMLISGVQTHHIHTINKHFFNHEIASLILSFWY